MEIKRYEKEYTNRVEEGFKENSKSIKIDSISISALLESKSYKDFLRKYYNKTQYLHYESSWKNLRMIEFLRL